MSDGDGPDGAAERLTDAHTKEELQDMARDADVPVSGTKAEIAERLVEAGVTADDDAEPAVEEADAEADAADAESDEEDDDAEAEDADPDDSEGDEEADDDGDEEAEDAEEGVVRDYSDADAEELGEALDEVAERLEAAETEADLDAIETRLDPIAEAVEALPDADEDAEDDPKGDLQSRVEGIEGDIEDQRGPYASDVVEAVEAAEGTLTDSEWTETGEDEAAAAVVTFVEAVNETLEADITVGTEADPADVDAAVAALGDVTGAVEAAALDADEDAETIAALVEAADALTDGLDAAETWDDLTVQQKLTAEGFYDRLHSRNRKDYPPELSVVRIAEQEDDPERVLMALDYLESEFMQENCMEALARMGSPEAFDEMNQRAQRRKELPITVLGAIGDPRALETLHPFIEGDSNPNLQRLVLKVVGQIGSDESTQHCADRLVAEETEVRSAAARALGRIGDPRAVEPLADLLADDDEDSVRASAAWALVQIGTEAALAAAADYVDDRSYIVQVEAEKAATALGEEAPAA